MYSGAGLTSLLLCGANPAELGANPAERWKTQNTVDIKLHSGIKTIFRANYLLLPRKMRYKLLLIFCFVATYTLNAQKLVTSIDNPAPRLGEAIELSYSLITTQTLVEEDEEDELDLWEEMPNNQTITLGSGTMNLLNYTNNIGLVKIGPLSININGQIYLTDTITIYVHPELPHNTNGVWIRLAKMNNETYLILEQQLVKNKDNFHLFSLEAFENDGVDFDFAKINVKAVTSENLTISKLSSSLRLITSFGSGYNSPTEVLYKKIIYRLDYNENYQLDFILTNEHILNFPENAQIEPILLN